tara:strand:+ start:126 stop:656 length:531 start_codon:yes stop_codon:yes gene_type:complete
MLADKSIQEELNKFAKYVIQQSRSNLSKSDKNVSKELYNSLGYNVEVTSKGAELGFSMEQYGEFQDKGVRGKSSSAKAPNSPFRFGSGTGKKGGLTNSIDKWVRRRGIQFKDRKSGRFLSYQSTAFLISRSIYQKGIKPSLFFTKPFVAAFKRLPDELLEAYSIGLEKDLIKLTEK